MLTPKQMFQRLSTALAQVKAGNTSENLLTEINQIIYSLYRSKEITKKVCNNTFDKAIIQKQILYLQIIKKVKLLILRLLFNLTGKINLQRSDKYVSLSNLSMYYTLKNIRKSYKDNKFKIHSIKL